MSTTIEQNGLIAAQNHPKVKDADAAPASLRAIVNGPNISFAPATSGISGGSEQKSPALDSLLNMINLKADSATLELYLTEIIQSSRDMQNSIGKNKIDLLTNEKLSMIKEKQGRIEEAQRKFDEAEKLQADTKIWSYVRLGVSLLSAVAGIALIATGVGAGAGMLMLGLAIATVSTVNEGVALATGQGIAGHAATAFGASKSTAGWCDTGFSIALAAAGILLLFGLVGLAAVPAAVGIINGASGITSAIIGIKNAVDGFNASEASAEGLRLNGIAKEYDATIQQLDTFLQHATDSMISSNNGNNELLTTLLRTYSDVSNAMTRVRFAS